MPQIPDQLRPAFNVIAKYHFWMLAAIVPLVLIPMLFQGTAALNDRISKQKSEIDGRVSALRGIQGIAEHPNDGWLQVVEGKTDKVQKETLAEWERFWKDQESLRVWPKELGDDFLKAVATMKPGRSLNNALLRRYLNTVPELVRELPKRMGADVLMTDGDATGRMPMEGPAPMGMRGGFRDDLGPPGMRGGMGPTGAGTMAPVEWAAEDQRRVLASFTWQEAPSTTRVVLAQEELWVYGLFCDTIKRINDGAEAGGLGAPITFVQELAVGYPAAEDQVGGQGTGRIVMPVQDPSAGEYGGMGEGGMRPEMGMTEGPGLFGEAGGGVAGRPPHPRFGSAGSEPGMMRGAPGGFGMEEGMAPVEQVSPDDALKQWIYVDMSGKPLTAAELATTPVARMVHLMPFVLRATMDQRKLDALLADLASNPIPIDVRQVRINPSQQTMGAVGGGRMGGGMPGEMSMPVGGDMEGIPTFNVTVEIRGMVGLAPRPDPGAISGEAPMEGGGA